MSTRREFFNTLAPAITLMGLAPAAKASNLILSWDTEGSDWLPSPDESASQGSRALFSKGLPHNNDGMPDEAAFSAFLEAIRSRNVNELERLRPKAGIPWVDPTAGIQLTTPATLGPYGSSWFGSKLMAGDLTELYWAALCRDIPFPAYGSSTLVSQANQDLVKTDGPRFQRALFSSPLPGASQGPFVSQFLVKTVPLGSTMFAQNYLCPQADNDFAVTIDAWHRCQDGESSGLPISYLPNTRYIFNGRSLAEYVRTDFSYQAYLFAALIIQSWGRDALNPGLSQRYTKNVSAFVSSGWWEVLGLLGQVSELALQDSWYWKWRVFRRLRPEELAGRIVLAQKADNSTFIDLPVSQTAPKICEAQHGTMLLSQAYPDGCPLHPSFPAAHAEIAGACVTVLKAFSDPSFKVPGALNPTSDGLNAQPYNNQLTLEGELNKLAWNIAFGRAFAGVHYRSDLEAGLLLGESIALKLLLNLRRDGSNKSKLWFRRFDGNWTSVET